MNDSLTLKVSVCLATYNGEKYLQRQIETILCQLGPDDELVISDDGSTDKTLSVIRSFRDERIKLFSGKRIGGVVKNFEHSLLHARGDIILLCDQDDVWLPNKVSLVRNCFAGQKGTIALVSLNGHIVDVNESPLGETIFERVGVGPGLLKNVYDNTYVGATLAFTRELLDVALPMPKRLPMHDMWLGLLAELLGEVSFVEEPTILYRRHGENATDFRVRFRPWLQIRRRVFLVWALGVRCLSWRLCSRCESV